MQTPCIIKYLTKKIRGMKNKFSKNQFYQYEESLKKIETINHKIAFLKKSLIITSSIMLLIYLLR